LFTPAQPVRLRDDVIAQFRDAIDDGHLPPGRRVPHESVLAEEFAVDRRTVRDALRALRRTGLLRARADETGRPFYVVRDRRD
jgi:DNA-binding FadR family transcriptional regulator